MAQRRNRYKEMERKLSYVLAADAALFVLYLLFAGLGIIWLKVTLAIIAILVSGLCLGFLYLSQELLRRRSLWMSASAAAILICILFSLILNYPSPNKYKDIPKTVDATVSQEYFQAL